MLLSGEDQMLETITILLVVMVVFDVLNHRQLREQVKNQGALLRVLRRKIREIEDDDGV